MRAARMHGYRQPLVLEDVKVPEIAADEVLLKVAAAGMCRTDAQMVDGYFELYHPLTFPITPGHEIAGTVEKIGSLVPKTAALTEGDQVVVVGGMGDGTCRLCQAGNTQICGHGKWPGFGPPGGYGEFVPIRYEYIIRLDKKYNLKAEELAPLTDAGLTPYRGIKKLRDAGALGPDRVMAVIGIGGLGAYAVQYAKLFSSGASVVAFGRNDEKLAVAKEYGADHALNIKNKSIDDIRAGVEQSDRQKRDRRRGGLRRRRRDHSDGIQSARHGGHVLLGRPGRHAHQHSTLPVRRPRVYLPRLVLGQLQRSKRSHRAGPAGKDQAHAEESQVRRHQRGAGTTARR